MRLRRRRYTGANMDRPALKRLLVEIGGRIDCVLVYKVDRLSRSIRDFGRMMDLFEKRGVSFVSVTQQFNTTTSLGRLTLNILLSFAQFEREIISERTRRQADGRPPERKMDRWASDSRLRPGPAGQPSDHPCDLIMGSPLAA